MANESTARAALSARRSLNSDQEELDRRMAQAYIEAYERMLYRIEDDAERRMREYGTTVFEPEQARLFDLTRELQEAGVYVAPLIERARLNQVRVGGEVAVETMSEELDPAIRFEFGRLNEDAVRSIAERNLERRPISQLLDNGVQRHRDKAAEILTTRQALGSNPREAARELTDRLRRVQGGTLSRWMTVARTEMVDANRAGLTAMFGRHKNLVRAKERMCAFDERTCMACIALDGTIYDLDAVMDEHQNGRCTWLPVLKPEFQKDARQRQNARDWFRTLDAAVQRRMMGTRVFELFQANDVQLQDLAHLRHNHGWRDAQYQATVDQALRNARVRRFSQGFRVMRRLGTPSTVYGVYRRIQQRQAYRTELGDLFGQQVSAEARAWALDQILHRESQLFTTGPVGNALTRVAPGAIDMSRAYIRQRLWNLSDEVAEMWLDYLEYHSMRRVASEIREGAAAAAPTSVTQWIEYYGHLVHPEVRAVMSTMTPDDPALREMLHRALYGDLRGRRTIAALPPARIPALGPGPQEYRDWWAHDLDDPILRRVKEQVRVAQYDLPDRPMTDEGVIRATFETETPGRRVMTRTADQPNGGVFISHVDSIIGSADNKQVSITLWHHADDALLERMDPAAFRRWRNSRDRPYSEGGWERRPDGLDLVAIDRVDNIVLSDVTTVVGLMVGWAQSSGMLSPHWDDSIDRQPVIGMLAAIVIEALNDNLTAPEIEERIHAELQTDIPDEAVLPKSAVDRAMPRLMSSIGVLATNPAWFGFTKAGTIERGVSQDTARHSSQFLETDYQGLGWAEWFNSRAFAYYVSHGVTQVSVSTTRVGSWYWAAQGFVPSDWDPKRYVERRTHAIQEAVRNDHFTEEDLSGWLNLILERAESQGGMSAQELAYLGREKSWIETDPYGVVREMWFGKIVLLDSGWHGYLTLEAPTEQTRWAFPVPGPDSRLFPQYPRFLTPETMGHTTDVEPFLRAVLTAFVIDVGAVEESETLQEYLEAETRRMPRSGLDVGEMALAPISPLADELDELRHLVDQLLEQVRQTLIDNPRFTLLTAVNTVVNRRFGATPRVSREELSELLSRLLPAELVSEIRSPHSSDAAPVASPERAAPNAWTYTYDLSQVPREYDEDTGYAIYEAIYGPDPTGMMHGLDELPEDDLDEMLRDLHRRWAAGAIEQVPRQVLNSLYEEIVAAGVVQPVAEGFIEEFERSYLEHQDLALALNEAWERHIEATPFEEEFETGEDAWRRGDIAQAWGPTSDETPIATFQAALERFIGPTNIERFRVIIPMFTVALQTEARLTLAQMRDLDTMERFVRSVMHDIVHAPGIPQEIREMIPNEEPRVWAESLIRELAQPSMPAPTAEVIRIRWQDHGVRDTVNALIQALNVEMVGRLPADNRARFLQAVARRLADTIDPGLWGATVQALQNDDPSRMVTELISTDETARVGRLRRLLANETRLRGLLQESAEAVGAPLYATDLTEMTQQIRWQVADRLAHSNSEELLQDGEGDLVNAVYDAMRETAEWFRVPPQDLYDRLPYDAIVNTLRLNEDPFRQVEYLSDYLRVRLTTDPPADWEPTPMRVYNEFTTRLTAQLREVRANQRRGRPEPTPAPAPGPIVDEDTARRAEALAVAWATYVHEVTLAEWLEAWGFDPQADLENGPLPAGTAVYFVSLFLDTTTPERARTRGTGLANRLWEHLRGITFEAVLSSAEPDQVQELLQAQGEAERDLRARIEAEVLRAWRTMRLRGLGVAQSGPYTPEPQGDPSPQAVSWVAETVRALAQWLLDEGFDTELLQEVIVDDDILPFFEALFDTDPEQQLLIELNNLRANLHTDLRERLTVAIQTPFLNRYEHSDDDAVNEDWDAIWDRFANVIRTLWARALAAHGSTAPAPAPAPDPLAPQADPVLEELLRQINEWAQVTTAIRPVDQDRFRVEPGLREFLRTQVQWGEYGIPDIYMRVWQFYTSLYPTELGQSDYVALQARVRRVLAPVRSGEVVQRWLDALGTAIGPWTTQFDASGNEAIGLVEDELRPLIRNRQADARSVADVISAAFERQIDEQIGVTFEEAIDRIIAAVNNWMADQGLNLWIPWDEPDIQDAMREAWEQFTWSLFANTLMDRFVLDQDDIDALYATLDSEQEDAFADATNLDDYFESLVEALVPVINGLIDQETDPTPPPTPTPTAPAPTWEWERMARLLAEDATVGLLDSIQENVRDQGYAVDTEEYWEQVYIQLDSEMDARGLFSRETEQNRVDTWLELIGLGVDPWLDEIASDWDGLTRIQRYVNLIETALHDRDFPAIEQAIWEYAEEEVESMNESATEPGDVTLDPLTEQNRAELRRRLESPLRQIQRDMQYEPPAPAPAPAPAPTPAPEPPAPPPPIDLSAPADSLLYGNLPWEQELEIARSVLGRSDEDLEYYARVRREGGQPMGTMEELRGRETALRFDSRIREASIVAGGGAGGARYGGRAGSRPMEEVMADLAAQEQIRPAQPTAEDLERQRQIDDLWEAINLDLDDGQAPRLGDLRALADLLGISPQRLIEKALSSDRGRLVDADAIRRYLTRLMAAGRKIDTSNPYVQWLAQMESSDPERVVAALTAAIEAANQPVEVTLTQENAHALFADLTFEAWWEMLDEESRAWLHSWQGFPLDPADDDVAHDTPIPQSLLDLTQRLLQERGVTHVALFRGIEGQGPVPDQPPYYRARTSWSLYEVAADTFAEIGGWDWGAVYQTTVPVDEILVFFPPFPEIRTDDRFDGFYPEWEHQDVLPFPTYTEFILSTQPEADLHRVAYRRSDPWRQADGPQRVLRRGDTLPWTSIEDILNDFSEDHFADVAIVQEVVYSWVGGATEVIYDMNSVEAALAARFGWPIPDGQTYDADVGRALSIFITWFQQKLYELGFTHVEIYRAGDDTGRTLSSWTFDEDMATLYSNLYGEDVREVRHLIVPVDQVAWLYPGTSAGISPLLLEDDGFVDLTDLEPDSEVVRLIPFLPGTVQMEPPPAGDVPPPVSMTQDLPDGMPEAEANALVISAGAADLDGDVPIEVALPLGPVDEWEQIGLIVDDLGFVDLVRTTESVNWDVVWASQTDVRARRVAELLVDPTRVDRTWSYSMLPAVLRYDGVLILIDGHHRVMAARLAGRELQASVLTVTNAHLRDWGWTDEEIEELRRAINSVRPLDPPAPTPPEPETPEWLWAGLDYRYRNAIRQGEWERLRGMIAQTRSDRVAHTFGRELRPGEWVALVHTDLPGATPGTLGRVVTDDVVNWNGYGLGRLHSTDIVRRVQVAYVSLRNGAAPPETVHGRRVLWTAPAPDEMGTSANGDPMIMVVLDGG